MNMKKWIIILCVFLVLCLAGWAFLNFWGEQVSLLEVLPQGEWRDFDGGCGNPSNPGSGLNVDALRGEDCPYEIPEDILCTTAENVARLLEGKQARHGIFKGYEKADYFRYDFVDEAGNAVILSIYENGCIVIKTKAPGEQVYQEIELRDKGQCYQALKEAFGDIHDYREWMGISD